MSTEEKYVLERNDDTVGVDRGWGYKITPSPIAAEKDVLRIRGSRVDFWRRHPDVEDRSRPDYSDVPVGTAGTATVNGVEGVRLIRKLDGWWLATYVEGTSLRHDSDHAVTDFTPDVVLTEGLIEFVRTKLRDLGFNGDDRITVVNILRDAS